MGEQGLENQGLGEQEKEKEEEEKEKENKVPSCKSTSQKTFSLCGVGIASVHQIALLVFWRQMQSHSFVCVAAGGGGGRVGGAQNGESMCIRWC